MSEKVHYFSDAVVRRVKQLINGNIPPSNIDVVEHARLKYRGFDYKSKIQRRVTKAVTAYQADHKLATSTLWNNGGIPKTVFRRTYSLEAFDNGERVILETSEVESTTRSEPEEELEDFGIELLDPVPETTEVNLARGGMVFDPDSIPPEEKARMTELFKL